VAVGIIKWFQVEKGYGFITPAEGGKDLFIHVSELEKINIVTVTREYLEGLRVEYEILTDIRGRRLATEVKVID
jgi:CspA family cold shock protein